MFAFNNSKLNVSWVLARWLGKSINIYVFKEFHVRIRNMCSVAYANMARRYPTAVALTGYERIILKIVKLPPTMLHANVKTLRVQNRQTIVLKTI